MDQPQPRGRSLKRRRSTSRSRSRAPSRSRSRNYSSPYTRSSGSDVVRLFPNSTIRLPTSQMPPAVIMPLNYSENVSVTCTAGSVENYVFRMNSLYDPNFTGTGHQPFYFDEMCALYTVYVVYGCSVEVTFTSASTNNVPVVCAIVPSLTSTSETKITTAVERKDAISATQEPSAGPLVLRAYFPVGATYGSTKNQVLADIAWQGTASTNPGTVSYIKLVAQPIDGATTSNVYMHVKLKYYAVFKQVIAQEES